MISRMPVARQFLLSALLGVALTVAGIVLCLTRSRDLAYDAKRGEIQHEAEVGVSIIRHFVQLEQSGALSHEEAQRQALDAVGAIRFAGVNYVLVLSFDGVSLANANKSLIGKNLIDLKDAANRYFVRNQVDIAKSGIPGFTEYYWTKIGETVPKTKLTYVMGVPEWRMEVAAGDFVDDLDATLISGVVRLMLIFVPLLAAYLAMLYVMRRGLRLLLGSMAESMRRLSLGDLEAEVPGQARRDEIGQMAAALCTFRQAAIEKRRLEGEVQATTSRMESEQATRERERADATEEQARVVDSLGCGLEKLSDGDVTFRLNDAFPSHYEKLRADFNAAMAKLQETLQVIAGNTGTIRSGSKEITSAADDLSRRTENQAASLEQTAAALDEITATVRKTADSTGHAASVVSAAKLDAETSGTVVQQAVEAMGAIEQSSNQIGQIISVIDEIAFQTNLLALNAGVEAARAGDAGRGFAVVASEVRALAQRSADAAKEIKGLILASTRHVASGVKLVDETGQSLSRIARQVNELNSIVAEIASSAAEQASGLAQVNTTVNQMDQVTQQNAAMVEQTTAASHSLTRESEELSTLIKRFRVTQDDSAAETRDAARSGVAAPAPGSRAGRSVAGSGKGRPSGSSRGSLALKQPAEAAWQDF